jgi:glutamyl-tRNA reductase
MAEETLRYLKDEGVRDVVVVNRSPERAQKLAEAWGGIAAPWTELHAWLARADVVINATSADQPLIDARSFAELRKEHRDRPVFLLDLGAPRGFAPNLGTLDNVFLYDIDSLQRTCEDNHRARRREIDKARLIIEEETSAFLGEFYRRASGDLVTRLRKGWHDIAQQELDKLFRRLPHLQATDREAVERSVEQIVNKLLHPPLEALRDESREGSPHGLLTALKRLFGLE